jgi:hypothetical protein
MKLLPDINRYLHSPNYNPFILRQEKRTHNKSICKSGAGHFNINYVQAPAAVRAQRSIQL